MSFRWKFWSGLELRNTLLEKFQSLFVIECLERVNWEEMKSLDMLREFGICLLGSSIGSYLKGKGEMCIQGLFDVDLYF